MAELYHYTNPGLVIPQEGPVSQGSTATQAKAKVKHRIETGTGEQLPTVEYQDISRQPLTVEEHIMYGLRAGSFEYQVGVMAERATFDPVEGYDPKTDENILWDAIPNDRRGAIETAQSPQEAMFMYNQVRESVEVEQKLAAEGMSGVLATVGASLFSPLSALGGVAELKAAGSVAKFMGASKAAQVVSAGAVGAKAGQAYYDIGVQAGQAANEDDLLLATVLGAGVGVYAGVVTPSDIKRLANGEAKPDVDVEIDATRDAMAAANSRLADEVVHNPAPANTATYADEVPPTINVQPMAAADEVVAVEDVRAVPPPKLTRAEAKKVNAARAKGIPLDERIQGKLDAIDAHEQWKKESVGAAKTVRPAEVIPDMVPLSDRARGWGNEFARFASEDLPDIMKKIPKSIPKGALDSVGKVFMKSGVPSLQWIGHELLETASGATTNRTASIYTNSLNNKYGVAYAEPYERGLKAHRAAMQKGMAHSDRIKGDWYGDAEADYGKQIVIELGNRENARLAGQVYQSTAAKHIREAADGIDNMTKMVRDDANIHGRIDDMEAFEAANTHYFPRVWNRGKIAALKATDPEAYVEAMELVARGIIQRGVNPKLANAMTKATFNRALSALSESDADILRLFDKGSEQQLRELLQDVIDQGYEAHNVDELLHRIQRDRASASTQKNFRPRMNMDITLSGEHVAIIDLLDTRVRKVMDAYSMQQAGNTALASKGIRGTEDIAAIRTAIDNEMVAMNKSEADRLAALQQFDGVMDQFVGRPINGGLNRNVARMLDTTRLMSLGMVGFSSAIELANLTARFGVLNVMKSTPEIVNAMRAARKGEHSPLFEEFNRFGLNTWDNQRLHRYDIQREVQPGQDAGLMNVVDKAIAKGKGIQGIMSGYKHIVEYLQRTAVTLEAGKIQDLAKQYPTFDMMPAGMQRRAESMGFDAQTWNGVTDAMNTYSTKDASGVLENLNLEKWPDGAAHDFVMNLNRSSGQLVQQTYIGEAPSMLNSEVGQLLLQFRTSPLLAMEKNLERNVHIRDMESVWTATSTLMLGTVLAAARMAVQGRQDEMTPGTIAAQAIQYMPMIGLAPDAVGVAAGLGMIPDSYHLRNWGAEQDADSTIGSVIFPPAIMAAKRVAGAVDIVADRISPFGDTTELTAAQARALKSSMVFGNLPMVNLTYQALGPSE